MMTCLDDKQEICSVESFESAYCTDHKRKKNQRLRENNTQDRLFPHSLQSWTGEINTQREKREQFTFFRAVPEEFHFLAAQAGTDTRT
jgi:hypothetical protein